MRFGGGSVRVQGGPSRTKKIGTAHLCLYSAHLLLIEHLSWNQTIFNVDRALQKPFQCNFQAYPPFNVHGDHAHDPPQICTLKRERLNAYCCKPIHHSSSSSSLKRGRLNTRCPDYFRPRRTPSMHHTLVLLIRFAQTSCWRCACSSVILFAICSVSLRGTFVLFMCKSKLFRDPSLSKIPCT